MSKKYGYEKLPNNPGIYKHKTSGHYQARKRIGKRHYRQTFSSLRKAKHWKNTFAGNNEKKGSLEYSTLAEVWSEMQKQHFPLLAESTQQVWLRRYHLLKDLEEYPMNIITSSVITKWVQKYVTYFKDIYHENNDRGNSRRCNLDNELNLFTTIFNWYKNSDEFEYEAVNLINPVKLKHKKLGFIRPKPIKNRAIHLDDALTFFSYLKPLYRDLALLQYYTASRIGEVAGLQWTRIDLKSRKMVIMETCCWDMTSKTFIKLNPHPKNKEPRPVYITDEIMAILKRRNMLREKGNGFVFHVEGKPLNYGTIQLNYREAQRKGNLPYSGTHILRHGMATLARKIGGGLDAVIAMTGHKDFKLADHYSKLDDDFQREVSEKIMEVLRQKQAHKSSENIIYLSELAQNRR